MSFNFTLSEADRSRPDSEIEIHYAMSEIHPVSIVFITTLSNRRTLHDVIAIRSATNCKKLDELCICRSTPLGDFHSFTQ